MSETVLKYNAPATSAFPSLSTVGSLDLLPKYRSSNSSSEVAAAAAEFADAVAEVEALPSEVDALDAEVAALDSEVAALDAEVAAEVADPRIESV